MTNCRLRTIDIYANRKCNLRCAHCSTGSSMQADTETYAHQYIPWLKEMMGRGISWRILNILGGEPTLHSGLWRFVSEMKPYGPVELTTNGTWLGDWPRMGPVLKLLDVLTISCYPSMAARVPGYRDRILELKKAYPGLNVRDITVNRFLDWGFRQEASPSEARHCHGWRCAWLGTDGRLSRCWASLHLDCNPAVTTGFREACGDGMFYDLTTDTYPLRDWYSRRPFPACSWCTGGLSRWTRQTQRN